MSRICFVISFIDWLGTTGAFGCASMQLNRCFYDVLTISAPLVINLLVDAVIRRLKLGVWACDVERGESRRTRGAFLII